MKDKSLKKNKSTKITINISDALQPFTLTSSLLKQNFNSVNNFLYNNATQLITNYLHNHSYYYLIKNFLETTFSFWQEYQQSPCSLKIQSRSFPDFVYQIKLSPLLLQTVDLLPCRLILPLPAECQF